MYYDILCSEFFRKDMKDSKWILTHFFILLVTKAASGVNEADRIRMEDPCAVEMQLQAGSVSDNLACVAGVEDDQQQVPAADMLQCFNITQLCDGMNFCRNGNDEGEGFTTPSQINCSEGIMVGTFVCSPTESVELMSICDGNKDCTGGEDERFTLCKNKCRGSYYGGCPITRMCNSSTNGVTCGECFPGYVTNPSSPTGDCLPVITISFEQESHTVVEGSSQQLQVCAHTTDRIKREQHLTVNAVITQAVGATQDDYSVPSMALMDLTFTSTQARACINISIIDDRLVEGNESFFVSLRFSEGSGRDQVLLGKPNTTTVTIVDNDVVSIGFADTCYNIITNTTPANVCLEIVNNIQLASIFRFELLLNINESCTSEPLTFVFGTNATTGSRACSEITQEQRTPCYNVSLDDSCSTSQGEGISVSVTFGGLRTVRVCPTVNNTDDSPGFCPARNFTSRFGTRFVWQTTPAGTNATFTCPNNPSFSVSRNCFSCSGAGIWLDYDRRGCGTLTSDLGGILSLVSGNTTTNSIIRAVQNLGEVIRASADTPVDQTRANLDTTAIILDSVANYLQTQRGSNTARRTIVRESVRTVNYLLQWTPTAVDSERSSRLVESFEVISSVYAQRLPRNTTRNITFQSITLIAQANDLEDLQAGRRVSIDGGNFIISVANTEPASPNSMDITIPTISLPGTLFERITDTNSTGLVFTLYGESTLFPVWNNTNNSAMRTVVGSRIIAANVAQRNTVFEDLSEPVVILLPLEIGDEGVLMPGSEVCASWDFDLQGWSRRGCKTVTGENGTVTCTCNHLTNFAVLVDICSRLEDCQPVNPVVNKILSFVSYIGIIISIIGLILTITTMLIFKKIREKESTVYNIQLSLALLLMLAMALVLVAVSSESVHNILYGGCVFISVSVHYFTLVAVMFMAAAALLMFQKVVMVFVEITVRQLVIVSLICWIIPVLPVLASLMADLLLGNDPQDDLIIRREEAESFCFLSHVGVFWGAFLGPILLVMVFNVVVFISVIFVLIRHVRGTTTRRKETMGYRQAFRLMLSIGGVMALFGLTWLFAILTVSVSGLRETFQILFTIFNSFQGFFIFLFFCVLNKEARDSWRKLSSRGSTKRGPRLLTSSSSSSKRTSTTAADYEMSTRVPRISTTTAEPDSKTLDLPLTLNKQVTSGVPRISTTTAEPDSKTLDLPLTLNKQVASGVPCISTTMAESDSKTLDLPLTLNKRVASDKNLASPSGSKNLLSPSESKASRVLGLPELPETSTFPFAPSKTTFMT